MRFVVVAVIFLLAAGIIVAHAAPAAPAAVNVPKGGGPRIEMDLDGDGRIDYALVNDARGLLEREEFDYNRDGAMDDFLYYVGGVVVREEIDSDYDGRIDIWVHLAEGKYIKRWERDLDGDGKPDKAQEF